MSEKQQLFIDRIETAIGEMILVADRDGNLRAIDWADHEARMQRLLKRHYGEDGFILEPAKNPSGLSDTLSRYFAGDLTAIDNVRVATAGTAFQREVWRALRDIPVGTTGRMQNLPGKSGVQKQFAPSVWPMAQTRLGLLSRVIAL